MSTCSTVCGLMPSAAETTSSTASIPVAPEIMVRTKRSWPGMSIRSATAPGSARWAKPSAMEMPRRFSSSSRSVSMPVSARTRAVLPWSTWPMTPSSRRFTAMRSGRRRRWRAGRRRRRPACPAIARRRRSGPPPAGSALAQAAGEGVDAGHGQHHGAAGQRVGGQGPAAGEAAGRLHPAVRPEHGAEPGRTILQRVRRTGSACAAPAGASAGAGSACRRSVASSAASVILSSRSARISGWRLSVAIGAGRPASRPACGPPPSLSPLNATTSAPGGDAVRGRSVRAPGRAGPWRRCPDRGPAAARSPAPARPGRQARPRR